MNSIIFYFFFSFAQIMIYLELFKILFGAN